MHLLVSHLNILWMYLWKDLSETRFLEGSSLNVFSISSEYYIFFYINISLVGYLKIGLKLFIRSN